MNKEISNLKEKQTTRKKLVSGMSLLSDEPEHSNIFFNFEEYAKQLSNLLESPKMITPFTIAIHGEWGSGKTTMLDIINRNINSSSDLKIIRFNAWEYERSDIVIALLKHIEKEIREYNNTATVTTLSKQILSLVLDVSLRNSIGMSKDDVAEHFDSHYKTITTVRATLENLIGDKKLAIFIDDLDRCLADNILNVLEAIKMFFNIKNIIIVMAIDITKIERAWELRYDAKIAKIEGREHVEKMFPLKLGLPPKSQPNLLDYVKHHAKSLENTDIEFILHNSQFNPRKIKRMLNLLYVILINLPDRGESISDINSNFKIDFKILISWIALTLNHPDIARQIQLEPSLLIRVSVICNCSQYHDTLLSFLNYVDKNTTSSDEWIIMSTRINKNVVTAKVYQLLKEIANEPSSFKIINHFADQFGLELNTDDNFIINRKYMNKIDTAFYDPLNNIIKRSGLIGV